MLQMTHSRAPALTRAGTSHMLSRYQELLGCAVEPCRFRVLRDDDVHGWLGASPDGLIASLTTPSKALKLFRSL